MRRYAVMAALMVLVGVVAGAVAVEADPGPKVPVNVQVVNDATSPVPVEVTNPLADAGPEVVQGSGVALSLTFEGLPTGVAFTDFMWWAEQNTASSFLCSNPYVVYSDDTTSIHRVPNELHLISGVMGANPGFLFGADLGDGCRFQYFWSGYVVTP